MVKVSTLCQNLATSYKQCSHLVAFSRKKFTYPRGTAWGDALEPTFNYFYNQKFPQKEDDNSLPYF